MSITTSDEYFAVHLNTPVHRMLMWENANRPKYPGTPATNQKYWAKQKAARAQAREDYRREYETLKAVGLDKERRFQYEETAKKWAAQIEAETGVKVLVSRQCDLFL